MFAGAASTKETKNFLHYSLKPIEVILGRIQQCTITVFGDSCLDAYRDLGDREVEVFGTWKDVAMAVFRAMNRPAEIEFIEMPETLRRK